MDQPSWWTTNDSPKGRWEVLQILNQGVWNPQLVSLAGAITTTTQNSTDDTPTSSISAGSARHKQQEPQQEQQNRQKIVEKLLHLIRNIPGLLDGCLFGNVLVSKIYPGTIIEPHCGPTNVRHRLQFVLERPSSSLSKHHDPGRQLSLQVGPSHRLFWDNNDNIDKKNSTSKEDDRMEMFVFDDSYVHSVTFPHQRHQNTHEANNDSYRTVLIVDLWHPDLSSTERTLLRDLYPPMA
jgi:Aspartyl/Asparaginyl beta-hydroxylase